MHRSAEQIRTLCLGALLPLLDPRRGDAEDDKSSPKQKSLLGLAGSLLVEISLPKLLLAWMLSVGLPALLLGLAPVLVTAWLTKVSVTITAVDGIGAAIALLIVLALGWIGGRPLLRRAEASFWALNALLVQPSYAICREAMRHGLELLLGTELSSGRRGRLRAAAGVAAAIILAALAVGAAAFVWPASRWVGSAGDLLLPQRLVLPILANALVVVCCYVAAASLVWGTADAIMEAPADLAEFDAPGACPRAWRVAHLSDLHAVGERYGFRLESGRGGPGGNAWLESTMQRLAAVHAVRPLQLIIVTGDMTDAGRSAEWAEFLDVVARYPALASRLIMLPGNHDVNIVDRANPARLDLPFSPAKRLRQMRALSAMAAVQGERMLTIDPVSGELQSLASALAPWKRQIEEFADKGGLRRSAALAGLWRSLFPMILPPQPGDNLGVAVMDTNADTHFSFTNALGLVCAEQVRRLRAALDRFPDACWILGLHHHVMEYPTRATDLSERIGTALVNGSWFVRMLRPYGRRVVVMHGHRHVDWIGKCGELRIISAPSPVMGEKHTGATYFYVHTLAAVDGALRLLSPERVPVGESDHAGGPPPLAPE